MENPLSEILVIDKPKGWSSYDCIRVLKKHYPKKTKIGHAGTLDPAATGLMIIGVGKATKQLEDFLKLPKTYTADILLGVKTDSGDLDGEVIEETLIRIDDISKKQISKILTEMTGTLTLPVPKFSAIKQNGKRLYKLAREGKNFTLPTRDMTVNAASLSGIFEKENRTVVRVEFSVESGVYIRSLAEEFGRRANTPATLSDLRRTSISHFSIEDAQPIEHFRN